MKILSLTILIVACTSILIQTDDQKVVVELYYESLCPYCRQFIVGSLKTASSTQDFWKICQFRLIPYGNAHRTQNGSSWSYTCQHGPTQCEGNLIETCTINHYQFYTQALPFILCLESFSQWSVEGPKCAQKVGLDWNTINTCAKGTQGNQMEAQMAKKTQQLNPPHSYVPWIVVNGQHSSTAQSSIRRDMVKYVCSVYSGPIKIAACN